MSKERQFIFEKKTYIDMWKVFDHKSFDDVKLELQSIEAQHEVYLKKGYRLEFSVSECGYDGGQELCINIFRPETDREMKKRIEHEEEMARKEAEKKAARKAKADERALKQLLASEEAERELYEKLKMKFESA